MADEKNVKLRQAAQYRAELMQGMSTEERVRFLKCMEIGDKIREEDREALKRLADS
jgi:hypothetical protein